jgi:3-oxoacyl-[acyl-carrier-protein] synthase II
MERKDAKRNDPFVHYSVAAALQAMEDAALNSSRVDADRFGVVIGSGIGGIKTWEEQYDVLRDRGAMRVSPFFVPMMITNMAAGFVAMRVNAKGPNYCVTSACASGAHAIGQAYRSIQLGEADLFLAGGSEATVTQLSVAGFCTMKALSTRNDEPELASRPFDSGRDGFVLSEGAAILVLERLEHALDRGADIVCELAGYGMSADAYHVTAPSPDGEGAARAMRLAIQDAKLRPEDVDYINAHGTSTPLNDRFETMAIKRVLGDAARKVAVSSTKSMTGHLLGAAGALEAFVVSKVVKEGVIPPTINLTDPDPECDLDYVPIRARKRDVSVALSNSLGFGGHNVTLAFRKFTD